MTHVVDNIDWENKSLTGDQTHTNSIIIQETNVLEPDYNFKRSEHKSFKGLQFNLPNIIFKRSEAKLLEYESDGEISINNNETKISKSRNLLWSFLRMNKVEKNPDGHDIPGCGGFHELCGEPSFPVRVGYLPTIRAPATERHVIYAAINCSLNIMDELRNKFIFMEVDQAIFHKVLDAEWKRKELQFLIKSALEWVGFISSSAWLERYKAISNTLR